MGSRKSGQTRDIFLSLCPVSGPPHAPAHVVRAKVWRRNLNGAQVAQNQGRGRERYPWLSGRPGPCLYGEELNLVTYTQPCGRGGAGRGQSCLPGAWNVALWGRLTLSLPHWSGPGAVPQDSVLPPLPHAWSLSCQAGFSSLGDSKRNTWGHPGSACCVPPSLGSHSWEVTAALGHLSCRRASVPVTPPTWPEQASAISCLHPLLCIINPGTKSRPSLAPTGSISTDLTWSPHPWPCLAHPTNPFNAWNPRQFLNYEIDHITSLVEMTFHCLQDKSTLWLRVTAPAISPLASPLPHMPPTELNVQWLPSWPQRSHSPRIFCLINTNRSFSLLLKGGASVKHLAPRQK